MESAQMRPVAQFSRTLVRMVSSRFMKGRLGLAPLLLFSVLSLSYGQNRPARPVASLPFEEISNGLILVQAHLNHGKDEPYLLDLGSTLALLVDRQSADRVGLRSQTPQHPLQTAVSRSKPIELTTWRSGVLRSGRVTLAQGDFPEADLSAVLRTPIAGILGVPVASRYVLEIDYDEHALRFYKTDKFTQPPGSEALELLPNGENSLLLLKGEVGFADGSASQLTFYVDSGLDEDMTLNHSFAVDHPDLTRQTASVSAKSYNDVHLEGFGVKIQNLSLGLLPARVDTAIVFSGDAGEIGKVSDGSIGAGVLHQFHLWIDLSRRKLYLAPRVSPVKPSHERGPGTGIPSAPALPQVSTAGTR